MKSAIAKAWILVAVLSIISLGGSRGALCQQEMHPDPAVSTPAALPDAPAPTATPDANSGSDKPVTVKGSIMRGLHDEVAVLTSPARFQVRDLRWFVPLTAATATAFVTDEKTMQEVVTSNPSFNQRAIDVSNGMVGGVIAMPVALFAAGSLRHDDHARETGILGSQAMVNAFLVGELVKLVSFRERPNVDNGEGRFFVGSSGANSSFVSEHSLIAWSSAAVVAGEYKSPWVQAGVYSLATGVSVTRVLGREHFPSDVLLGSAAGWLIGHYVYKVHHHWHRAE